MQDYQLTANEFELFRSLIHRFTGISLNDGKKQLVQSRLQKRLRHLNLSTYTEYYALVSDLGPTDPERRQFINCVTTNKTDFFREPHHFDFVQSEVIPQIIEDVQVGGGDRTLRVWHAGCSTGEEPYSLAVTLAESALNNSGWTPRQLASDIDTDVLDTAERGVYDESKVAPIASTLLRKYFLRRDDPGGCLFKVKPNLAAQIRFRCINLLDDNWPIRSDVKFDMIFCRNVVIYFDKPTQKKLFQRFANRLRPGGYLFIGHSESLLGISDAFESVGQTVYRLSKPSPSVRTQ